MRGVHTKYSRTGGTQYILTVRFEDRNKHSFALTSNVPREDISKQQHAREKTHTHTACTH